MEGGLGVRSDGIWYSWDGVEKACYSLILFMYKWLVEWLVERVAEMVEAVVESVESVDYISKYLLSQWADLIHPSFLQPFIWHYSI